DARVGRDPADVPEEAAAERRGGRAARGAEVRAASFELVSGAERLEAPREREPSISPVGRSRGPRRQKRNEREQGALHLHGAAQRMGDSTGAKPCVMEYAAAVETR